MGGALSEESPSYCGEHLLVPDLADLRRDLPFMEELSIIIPTRNRAQELARALRSIAGQSLNPRRFELVVVDNGSTDGTKTVVEEFRAAFPNLLYIYDGRPGLHVGRNRGLFASHADVLVYGDDDIEAQPSWLDAVAEAFKNGKTALVGGKSLPRYEGEPPEWLGRMWEEVRPAGRYLSYLSILDLGESVMEISPYLVFGCNFSIRKAVLLEAGGFHPDAMPGEMIRLRGDGESAVARHIEAKGYRALYHPGATVYHRVGRERMTEEYFRERAYKQGISDSYSLVRRGKRGSAALKLLRVRFRKLWFLAKDDRLRAGIEDAYIRGFAFHQMEVKNDPELLQWVKKRDYFDQAGDVK
jgi:glucosyl-dolichyl phosphate glucuronosyltransferase